MTLRFRCLCLLLLAHQSTCQQCESIPISVEDGPGHPKYVDVRIKKDGSCKAYRLYLATYATQIARSDFCIAATSAIAHGFEVNVLGTQRQKQFDEFGPLDKIWALRQFLELLPDHPNVIIAFIDAYDTIINGSPKTLVRKFLATGHRILFASEKGCCSTKEHMRRGRNNCDELWPIPPVKTATPHLNSGAFVGFRKDLRKLLRWSEKEYNATTASLQPGEVDPYKSGGDQMLICQLFSYGGHEAEAGEEDRAFVRERLRMAVDYRNALFMCMYNVDLIREVSYTKSGRVAALGAGTCDHLTQRFAAPCQGVVPTWSYPIMLHFNGAGAKKTVPLKTVAGRVSMPINATEAIWAATLWQEAPPAPAAGSPGPAGPHPATLRSVCGDLVKECVNRTLVACFADAIRV